MDNSKSEGNLKPNPLLPPGEDARGADEGVENRKKILLVTRPIAPPWDEASKNFAFTLAKNLPDFEFTLLTHGKIGGLPENVRREPIYTANNFSTLQKLRLLKYLKRLKKNDFDILHFLFTPTKLNTFLNRKIISKLQAKTIQTIATLREDLYSDAEIKKLMFADRIVTYSKYAKDKLNDLALNNAKQVYPGIDLDLYKPEPKDKGFIENLKLNIADFIVTYPGEFTRLGATDDIVDLIQKYSNLLNEKKIKIIFACRVKNEKDRQKKKEIEKILAEKGLADLVRLPDTFTTMEKVFNLSDAVIFPVRDMKGKFDVPLAVIEAMACGKPVIISDLPILREFTDDQNSVIIKSGDRAQLMDAISNLYGQKAKREEIGKNAREFIAENFDIKKVAMRYGEIYKNLNEVRPPCLTDKRA